MAEVIYNPSYFPNNDVVLIQGVAGQTIRVEMFWLISNGSAPLHVKDGNIDLFPTWFGGGPFLLPIQVDPRAVSFATSVVPWWTLTPGNSLILKGDYGANIKLWVRYTQS